MSANGTAGGVLFYKTCNDAVCGLKITTVFSFSVLTVLANLLALVTIATSSSLKNAHGFLLISLCLADLTTGLVACTSIYPSLYNLWPFGDNACLVAATVEVVVKKVSLVTLTLLSIERYIAVVYPFKYARIVTKRKVIGVLALCWLVPVVLFVVLFSCKQVNFRFVFLFHSCTVTYQNQALSIVLNLLIFVAPSMTVLCFTSGLAWREMKKSIRIRIDTRNSCGRVNSTVTDIKFFRMSRIIAFTFYLCWAPQVVVGTVSLIANVRTPLGIFFVLYWLQYSNSLWNVIIYLVMNNAFKKRALELLCFPANVLRRCCHTTEGIRSGQPQLNPACSISALPSVECGSQKQLPPQ